MSARLARSLAALAGILALAACGATGASTTTAESLGLPASAIPTSTHPDLHGMSVAISDQGSPSVDRILVYHITSLLRSWGAGARVDWASSQQIASSAILKGSDQVYASTIADALPSVQHGFNVVAFGLNEPKLDYVLIVNSHITSIKQLKGQSVGVLTGSPDDITWVLLKQALQSSGLDIPDVNLVTIGGQVSRVDALVSGRVAATVVSHQYLQRLAPSGFHSLADFAQRDPNVYNDIFWAPPDWLKANPKLAVAFNMAALDTYRAMDDLKTRPALIAEDVANSPGATTAQAQALFDVYVKYDMFPPNAVMTQAALTSQEKMYYNYHTIDSAPPISKWAVTKYDEAALKVLGTVKTGNS